MMTEITPNDPTHSAVVDHLRHLKDDRQGQLDIVVFPHVLEHFQQLPPLDLVQDYGNVLLRNEELVQTHDVGVVALGQRVNFLVRLLFL